MTPTKEQLEEEWLTLSGNLMAGQEEYKQIAMMHAACLMSVKHMIDIRVFMWKIAGIKAGKYDLMLKKFEEHGVGYYTHLVSSVTAV